MKKRTLILLRAACVFALAVTAISRLRAEDANSAAQIRVEVLMLSMPEEKFATLAPDLLDAAKIEKALPDLLEAVKRKEIMLEGCPMLVTTSGQRAVVETVVEYGSHRASQNHRPFPDITDKRQPQEPIVRGSPSRPSKARNIGVTFEVEPVACANGLIQMDVAPQHVELLGHDYFVIPANKKEDSAFDGPWQPTFYAMKTTTSLTLRSGRHLLLAVHKKAKPAGTVEIFIIGAEILTVGSPPSK